MTLQRDRAIRFFYPPAIDEPGIGFQLTATGGLEVVEDDRAIRQAIILLLSTRPGERVMRPSYGCSLHRLLFAANDDTTAGLAIHYVRQALQRWEKRIVVTKLDATRDPEFAERLIIVLDYRIRATQQNQQLQFPLELAGGTI
jgi:phage baseplate assembly protein W